VGKNTNAIGVAGRSRSASGAPGEVCARGDQISGEYAGRKVIRDDGSFPTNDHGWMDEEDFLFVEGRIDDVVVTGGENISASEVEEVLRKRASCSAGSSRLRSWSRSDKARRRLCDKASLAARTDYVRGQP